MHGCISLLGWLEERRQGALSSGSSFPDPGGRKPRPRVRRAADSVVVTPPGRTVSVPSAGSGRRVRLMGAAHPPAVRGVSCPR